MKSGWQSARALRIPISRYFEMIPLFYFFKQTIAETSMKFLYQTNYLVSSGALLVFIKTTIKYLAQNQPILPMATSFYYC